MTTTFVAALVGALLLSFVVVVALGASRLRLLSSRIGSFECAARRSGDPGDAWTAGIAHYAAGRIEWWRSWSLAPRPARTWVRPDLRVLSRSPFVGPGGQDQLVVRCRHRDEEFELTMSADAAAGLTAWLEAAPPTGVSRVV